MRVNHSNMRTATFWLCLFVGSASVGHAAIWDDTCKKALQHLSATQETLAQRYGDMKALSVSQQLPRGYFTELGIDDSKIGDHRSEMALRLRRSLQDFDRGLIQFQETCLSAESLTP